MNSLDEGKSPTINVRVPASRKAQLQAIAEYRGVTLSGLIQDVVSQFVMGTNGDERAVALRALREG